LAAGIALGLVNLNNPKIDSELELEHRLIKFVEGGK
jgi:methionine synthase II (cobalamin-independent)